MELSIDYTNEIAKTLTKKYGTTGGEKMKRTVMIIMSFILTAMMFSACGGSGDINKEEDRKPESTVESVKEESRPAVDSRGEEPTQTPSTESAAEPESPYYFRDLELVTSDYSIKITDWRVINPGEPGNEYSDSPVIAFWYDTTNTSAKEIDPMSAWIYVMTAVQDNDPNAINSLNVAGLPDSQFTNSQMQKIKQGGTVPNAMAYTLTDTETPIELTAKGSMFGDAIGSMTFDIVSMEASNGAKASIGTTENAPKAEVGFANNVLVTDSYTIEITDYRVIPAGEAGNEYGSAPVIAFWYTTTNTSGKEIDPMSAWIYVMTAVQDNDPNAVNELDVAMLPDSRFTETQMQKIKAGGSVESAMAYELTDTETEVTLTAKSNLFGPELGSQTFQIQ